MGDPGKAPELPHTQFRALLSNPGSPLPKPNRFGLSQLPFGILGQLPSIPDPPKETFASALALPSKPPITCPSGFPSRAPLPSFLQLQPQRALQHLPPTCSP